MVTARQLEELKQSIRELTINDSEAYGHHQKRVFASSGREGYPIFAVLSAHTLIDPKERADSARKSWSLPLGSVGWERSWGIFHDGLIVGEISLSTSRLAPSQMHRAILGMAIERDYRSMGLGRVLMNEALSWAKTQTFLAWVDLGVFSHNHAARNLYRSFGFREQGRIPDCFRVDDQRIEDIQMTLDLQSYFLRADS